jgi:hypothetical protein
MQTLEAITPTEEDIGRMMRTRMDIMRKVLMLEVVGMTLLAEVTPAT